MAKAQYKALRYDSPFLVKEVEFEQKIFQIPMNLMTEDSCSREEFIDLCNNYPQLKFEREKNGKIRIMSPVKFGSGKREFRLGLYIGIWWEKN